MVLMDITGNSCSVRKNLKIMDLNKGNSEVEFTFYMTLFL